MRKRIALNGAAVACAMLAGTLAWSAPDTIPAGRRAAPPPEAAAAARQPVTVQRLLSDRIAWALRLARAARALEAAPSQPVAFGPQTIVDEPDPTSAGPKERPDYWPKEQARPSTEGDNNGMPLPSQPLE
jgi:hypothetical protein